MSLRIHRPPTANEDPFSEWMERLVKLMPAEIVSAYALVRGFGNELFKTIVWPLIFLILTFVFRAITTKEMKSPQWLAAGISSVAFVFWVYITGGTFFNIVVDAQVMSGLMLAFMLFVSKLYKGD